MIPESRLEEVRKQITMEQVLRSTGLTLSRHGTDFLASCPFHKVGENEPPTLSIDPGRKSYHCTECGEKGNVFQFVQKTKNLTFPKAVEYLEQLANQKPTNESTTSPESLPKLIPEGTDYHLTFGVGIDSRTYRVRSLHKNTTIDTLKINLQLKTATASHLDTVDLYTAKSQKTYISHSASETGLKPEIIKKDLEHLLHSLETLQQQRLTGNSEAKPHIVTSEEREHALEFAKSPDLIDRILYHLTHCGHYGENLEKLFSYICSTSRLMDSPLSVIIQGSSGSGKTELMKAVLNFMPPEDVVSYSSMTGNALYYMGRCKLKHKILSIEEQMGAENISYALKLLLSEKEVQKATVMKNPSTGEMGTEELVVEGPTMGFSTDTQYEVDPELANRCFMFYIDESDKYKKAVMNHLRFLKTLEGKRYLKRAEGFFKLHQNFQRILKPINIHNPYSEQLRFSAKSESAYRNLQRYLNLIETIAFLHQHQRPIKKDKELGEHIEVTKEDIALAGKLMVEIMGKNTSDLPPKTKEVYSDICKYAKEAAKKREIEIGQVQFSRRQLREHLKIGNTQLRVHLTRLVELEYLGVSKGTYGVGYTYYLLYYSELEEENNNVACSLELVDVKALKKSTPLKQPKNANLAGGVRPNIGGVTGVLRGGENSVSEESNNTYQKSSGLEPKKRVPPLKKQIESEAA